MNGGAGKVTAIAAHRLSKVVNELVTDALFELAGSNIFIKVNDFFVKSANWLD